MEISSARAVIERDGIGYVDGHRSTGSTEGVLLPVILDTFRRDYDQTSSAIRLRYGWLDRGHIP